MTQPTPPYTNADVELVAKTLWAACGVPSGQPSPGSYDDARAVLDALTAADRLKMPRVSSDGPCLVAGCDGGRFSRGYCTKHYNRLLRTGDPLGARTRDNHTSTAIARKAFHDRWEKQVDPEGKLDPADRAERASEAKSAYYAALASRRWSSGAAAAEVKP